jgi:hypothetical protein
VPDHREAILDIAAKHDLPDATNMIFDGPKDRAKYAISIGIETITAKERARNRRELRSVVQPRFKQGKTIGSVVLTDNAKKRLVEHAQDLFTGWMINATVSLGNATKEDLLDAINNEQLSARGHLRNVEFYSALAEPLKPGQRVSDYWRNSKTVAKIRDQIWDDATI